MCSPLQAREGGSLGGGTATVAAAEACVGDPAVAATALGEGGAASVAAAEVANGREGGGRQIRAVGDPPGWHAVWRRRQWRRDSANGALIPVKEIRVHRSNDEKKSRGERAPIVLWIPCRSGMCTTPMAVTCSQLTANEIFPPAVVKTLVYPGALVNGLVSGMNIPSWDNLLDIYNLTNAKNSSAMVDLQRLEVLAGSYFSVAGAFVGLIKPGRMTLFGVLLVVWGLVKEAFLGKPENTDPATAVYVYPTILIALVCAFSTIRYDVKKVTRGTQARPVATPLQTSAKSKLGCIKKLLQPHHF